MGFRACADYFFDLQTAPIDRSGNHPRLCAIEKWHGRGGETRTPGPLVPNQMRYQTALHPATMTSLVVYVRFVKKFFES